MRVACIGHGGACLQSPRLEALVGVVTKVPADAFTLNSNSTIGNIKIEANFSYKKLNFIKNSFNFLQISQKLSNVFKIYSKSSNMFLQIFLKFH